MPNQLKTILKGRNKIYFYLTAAPLSFIFQPLSRDFNLVLHLTFIGKGNSREITMAFLTSFNANTPILRKWRVVPLIKAPVPSRGCRAQSQRSAGEEESISLAEAARV